MILDAPTALVGHTGFVGSTLLRTRTFTDLYNSRTIASIAGRAFDVLVCAGAPASMWAANRDPAGDEANLKALGDTLSTVKAKHLVLISTIAVLDDPAAGYDERHASYEVEKAYGRNRRAFEERLRAVFPTMHTVRLPALFGAGLKKNFVFDVINPVPSFLPPERFAVLKEAVGDTMADALAELYRFDTGLNMMALNRSALALSPAKEELTEAVAAAGMQATQFTNSQSEYQYYDMSRLAEDIDRVIENDLDVVNICSEPIAARDIHVELTGVPFDNDRSPLVREDMRTVHADMFGGTGHYLYDRADTLARLKRFYRAETGR